MSQNEDRVESSATAGMAHIVLMRLEVTSETQVFQAIIRYTWRGLLSQANSSICRIVDCLGLGVVVEKTCQTSEGDTDAADLEDTF